MNTRTPPVVEVIHEDPLVAAGLRAVLCSHCTVREAASRMGNGEMPRVGGDVDIIVTGFDAAMALLTDSRRDAARERARLLIVASHCREWDVRTAVKAGAHGYVTHGPDIAQVVNAVDAVALGRRYFCPQASLSLAECVTREALTRRESEVLRHLSRGLSNKHIARELDLAVDTVKTHVAGILSKLHATTRTEAVANAAACGLLEHLARCDEAAPRHAPFND